MEKWLALFFAVVLSEAASAQGICSTLDGAFVVSSEGEMLGKITSKYDSDSILNEYGDHGSKYASDSIWNDYGDFGGKYASKSPFNPYTSTPPIIILNGNAVAYLSVTKRQSPTVHPMLLKTCE